MIQYYGTRPDGRPFMGRIAKASHVYFAWDIHKSVGYWVDTDKRYVGSSRFTPDMSIARERWVLINLDDDYTMDEGL